MVWSLDMDLQEQQEQCEQWSNRSTVWWVWNHLPSGDHNLLDLQICESITIPYGNIYRWRETEWTGKTKGRMALVDLRHGSRCSSKNGSTESWHHTTVCCCHTLKPTCSNILKSSWLSRLQRLSRSLKLEVMGIMQRMHSWVFQGVHASNSETEDRCPDVWDQDLDEGSYKLRRDFSFSVYLLCHTAILDLKEMSLISGVRSKSWLKTRCSREKGSGVRTLYSHPQTCQSLTPFSILHPLCHPLLYVFSYVLVLLLCIHRSSRSWPSLGRWSHAHCIADPLLHCSITLAAPIALINLCLDSRLIDLIQYIVRLFCTIVPHLEYWLSYLLTYFRSEFPLTPSNNQLFAFRPALWQLPICALQIVGITGSK